MASAPIGSSHGFASTRRLGSAKAHEFPLNESFKKGYRNREDKTTLPPGVMVEGSQNVLTNTFNRVGIRKGYTLDGQSAAGTLAPILGSFDWERHTGDVRHLRAGFNTSGTNGKLQYRYVATVGDKWMGNTFTEGQVYWIDLMTSLTSVNFNFADFWDFSNEVKSLLLFVNGLSNINEWSGGVTTLKSTSNAMGVIESFDQLGIITAVTVGTGGDNYILNDLLRVVSGGGNAIMDVSGVLAGSVTAMTITSGGTGYAVGAGQTTVPSTGYGNSATVNVTTVSSNAGAGYIIGDILTANAGNVDATFKVTDVTDTGAIVSLLLVSPGTGYAAATVPLINGTGTGATLHITKVAQGWIEKTGTKSWVEEGFYNLTSNRAVVINGNPYTYSGGETTTFLVGVSPDPTGEPIQSVVHQQTITTLNSGMKGIPFTFKNTLIANLKNQIYISSPDHNDVYVSRINNYKDYTFTAPVRKPGEGAVLTLDNVPTALSPQQTQMYISAGKDQWYFTVFQLSADLAGESLEIERLKTTALQAAQTQALLTKIKNKLCFVSFEPIVNTLGTSQNYLLDPQTDDLSYSIVNDMNRLDFTDGSIIYHKQFVYLAVPKNNTMLIYNMTDPREMYWESPQILPAGRFSVIDGELYIHSYFVSETYKLFDGFNDNGNPINALATFSFNNYGTRPYPKKFTRYFVEGYISQNTKLILQIQYDVDGCSTIVQKTIDGTDSRIVCLNPPNNSLGKNSLGKFPLGGNLVLQSITATPPKFRVVKTFSPVPFYEEQTSFSTDSTDARWEIICFGAGEYPSSEGNVSITE